jgi:DNA-binding transcriptional LysR family regulator
LLLNVNEYLATAPFDIYELFLFRLVAKYRSFTKAAEIAGLTQSAITRQVQGMESSLGLQLLERTTRTVRVTPAGEYLFRESARVVGDVEQVMRRLREEFAGARKVVRVGVARTIGLAHLPGFFHANLRRSGQIGYRVSYRSSTDILAALEANDLDIGILCPPPRLPRTVSVTHRFRDDFTLIAPTLSATNLQAVTRSRKSLRDWMERQDWLLIDESANTGRRLGAWMKEKRLQIEPAMQLDSFDLIINLVALGMGVSFVPIRALALYGRKRTLQRIPMPDRFVRELVVVVRRHGKLPEHLSLFVGNILF